MNPRRAAWWLLGSAVCVPLLLATIERVYNAWLGDSVHHQATFDQLRLWLLGCSTVCVEAAVFALTEGTRWQWPKRIAFAVPSALAIWGALKSRALNGGGWAFYATAFDHDLELQRRTFGMLAEGAALAQLTLVCLLAAWLLVRESRRRFAVLALAAPIVIGIFVIPQIPARLMWTTMLGISFAHHVAPTVAGVLLLVVSLVPLLRPSAI